MSDSLNEFAVSLPIVNVAPVAAPNVTDAACDVTANYSLPPEVNSTEASHISVSIDSYPMVNHVPDSPMISIELVLRLGITCPVTGTYSSYNVVKRVSMDKCKLAHQAECLTPLQVIEASTPEEEAKKLAEAQAAHRARQLAGLI